MATSSAPDPYAPLTLAQLLAAAKQQAQDTIDAESGPIKSARDAYDRQAALRRSAYVQLSQAAADLMKGIGPGIQAGYETAAKDLSSIASPLTEGVRADLQKSEDANRAFVESQVAGADPSKAPNAADLKDVLFGEGAIYPSQELQARGLAGLTWGLAQPGIAIGQGVEMLRKLDADIDAQDKQYTQQLIDVANKFPELRAQALSDLRKWQLDVSNYKLDLRKQALQERAQTDIEQQLGIKTKQTNATIRHQQNQDTLSQQRNIIAQQRADLQAQGLKLRAAKQAADLANAQQKGAQPNASLSKTYGFVVDSDGQPILDSKGKEIPVAASKSKSGKGSSSGQKISSDALSLKGKPQANPDIGPASPGRFLAKPGAKGVFPARGGFPATTNDPNKAISDRTMSPQQAIDYLVQKYGISRQKARAYLKSAGWFG